MVKPRKIGLFTFLATPFLDYLLFYNEMKKIWHHFLFHPPFSTNIPLTITTFTTTHPNPYPNNIYKHHTHLSKTLYHQIITHIIFKPQHSHTLHPHHTGNQILFHSSLHFITYSPIWTHHPFYTHKTKTNLVSLHFWPTHVGNTCPFIITWTHDKSVSIWWKNIFLVPESHYLRVPFFLVVCFSWKLPSKYSLLALKLIL